jgi:outer membrane receptor protein involved in Fe transport
LLANYQPVNETQQYATAPLTFTSLSKGHVTGFVNYQLGNWGISLQNRWYSGYSKIQPVGQFYTDPRVKSIDYLDVNLDRKFQVDDATFDAYFSVQNIGDTRPLTCCCS